MVRFIALTIFFLSISTSSLFSQSNIKFGITGGIQLNSATLPNIVLNESISDILNGDDVVKGEPQFADMTLSYRFGGFTKHENRFGYTQLYLGYSTAKIHEETKIYSGILGNYSITTLDRKYNYFDVNLAYNLFLSKNHTVYIGLGGGLSFLLSYTGNEEPSNKNWNAFFNFGVAINKNLSIQTQVQLGLNEVYKGSYIHHITIPVTLALSL